MMEKKGRTNEMENHEAPVARDVLAQQSRSRRGRMWVLKTRNTRQSRLLLFNMVSRFLLSFVKKKVHLREEAQPSRW